MVFRNAGIQLNIEPPFVVSNEKKFCWWFQFVPKRKRKCSDIPCKWFIYLFFFNFSAWVERIFFVHFAPYRFQLIHFDFLLWLWPETHAINYWKQTVLCVYSISFFILLLVVLLLLLFFISSNESMIQLESNIFECNAIHNVHFSNE